MAHMAVVGMSCRFPGASNPSEFWRILAAAEPQFGAVPKSRWDHSAYYRPGEFREPHSVYTDQVSFLSEVDRFAPAHYGIPPRRARTMDPQAKLFVDLAREALQDAGWERDDFDRGSTGVFAGVTSLDHRDISVSRVTASLLADGSLHEGVSDPALLAGLQEATDSSLMPFNSFTVPGALANMVPATVSEVLNLGGPSFSVDAACSSALVALDTAVRSLRTGACSIALVGGVYLSFSPTAMVGFARAGALSRDGVCRPFDERADGFVLGEGGATLVLRPLEDALAAGDRVYAVVTGVGTANDGRGGGPMTPQAEGQLAALRAAYRDAGTTPGEIGLLEAHGTGTPLGDRTEMEALRKLRGESGTDQTCYVSSSKALIGHTLSAAGAAGLLKAALALHHQVVPPQPADIRPGDREELAAAGLRVTTEPQPWPQLEEVRRAGVSSFGFGGTNVHAVLEGAPAAPRTPQRPTEPGGARTQPLPAGQQADEPWLFLLSAGSVPDLARYARDLHRYVSDHPEATAAAVARTLATREPLTSRLSLVAATREELLKQLESAAAQLAAGTVGTLADGVYAAAEPLPAEERRIAFAFPGQGSQQPGMLADLVRRFPVLAQRAAELAKRTADVSETLPQTLPELLWEHPGTEDAAAQAVLTVTDVCQPGLGISGVSTVELLAACGVEPDTAVGHSVGEFPAAVAAGAFAPEDAVRFMAVRGAALAAAVRPGTGAMLAVQAPVDEAERLAADVPDVWPACYNHEGQLVFSGGNDAVAALRDHLAANGTASVLLKVSHAFHSPLVSAADEAMAPTIAELPLSAPKRTFVSAVSGKVCREPEEIKELWARHNTAPVRFVEAVRAVADSGTRFLVQVYGGDTLLKMSRRNKAGAGLSLLAVTGRKSDAGRAFLTTLAQLAVAGVPVDPAALFPAGSGDLQALPPSPLKTAVYTIGNGKGRARPAGSPAPDAAGTEARPAPGHTARPTGDSLPFTALPSPIAPSPALAIASATPRPTPADHLGDPSMTGLIEFLHAQVALLQSFDPASRNLPHVAVPESVALTAQRPGGSEAGQHGVVPALPAGAPERTALAMDVPVALAAPVATTAPAEDAAAEAGPAEDVAAVVFTAIAAVSAYAEDFLRTDHTFANDLGFDSIMLTEVATRLHKQWPTLEVTAGELADLTTVGSLITTIQGQLSDQLATLPVRPEPAAPARRPAAPAAAKGTKGTKRKGSARPAKTAQPAEPRRAEPAAGTRDADRGRTADVRLFPEVLASLERTRTIEEQSSRNPYFLPHEGTIRDTTRVGDHELISFSSYNYLGLSGHPAVATAITEAVDRYGSSVSAARILSGNRPLHEELDRGLARLVGAQDAVSLVSGHATNVTVIGHLMGPEDLILHDSLAHDSIIQGCRQSGAARQPFPHNDNAALDRLLTQVRDRYRRVLIVVEGVYSMDGDTADMPTLIALKEKHGALLMVDEAHSIGVMGKTGGGMAQFSGVDPDRVDIWMGTLSKSLASCGGYVAGRHELIEHFRYTLPGFVFSAGLPPASTAAALTALRLIEEEPERVTRLHDNSRLFLRLSAAAGVDVGTSSGTPIVPAITGDSQKALRLADRLYARGVSANPILHPAVEERLARLRFFITSEHTEEQITRSVGILAEELDALS